MSARGAGEGGGWHGAASEAATSLRCHHLSPAAMVPACRLPSSSLFLSLDLALTFPSERASLKAAPRPSVLKSGRRWLHETKAI